MKSESFKAALMKLFERDICPPISLWFAAYALATAVIIGMMTMKG